MELQEREKDIGLTHVKIHGGLIEITHCGNMGSSIERNVSPNLKELGIPTIEELKKTNKVIEEEGSPDYIYYICFRNK